MNSYLGIADTLAVDNRLLTSSEKKVIIKSGASKNSINRQTASSISNSQVLWNVVLNSAESTVIDPYILAEITINVTLTATGLAQTVQSYVEDSFALRQYPLNSVTQVCNVQINNSAISTNPNQFCHGLSWFQDFLSSEAAYQSSTPIMEDQSYSYNLLAGSQKNPLNNYVDGGQHYTEPRGSFNSLFNTITSTTGTWNFTYTIHEPLMNPLLAYSPSQNEEGLAYVNQLNVQLNFVSNLSRMFSLDAVACPAITGLTVNITNANLVMNWLTVPTIQKLPDVVLKSFNNIVCNQTQCPQFTAGQQLTVQTQSYSLNQIPRKIWLWVANAAVDVVSGYTMADFFFSIQLVSILFNNDSNLLANLSAYDLYNLCQAQSGCKMTYVQSQEFVGSVLELDPVKLFQLADDLSAGVLGTFNFQCSVQCTNISNTTLTPTIWVTTALDNILTTNREGVSNIINGWLTRNEIIQAKSQPAHAASFVSKDIYGGGFFDTLKSGLTKAFNFARNNKLLSKGLALIPHPFAQVGSKVASSLGFGGGYDDDDDYTPGGRRTSRREMGRRYNSSLAL